MPGADRLVRVGVDAEGDAHEHAAHSGGRGEVGLVRRVEHDGRPFRGGLGQEGLVLVVPVHDELVAGEPGCAGEGELARGRDVRADSLRAEQPQHLDVGERLRPVGDVPAAGGRLQRAAPALRSVSSQ